MELEVYTFAPDWGLPTTGPFALKLLAWLNLNGIAYQQVIENRPSKGPRGKSPWVALDGRLIGDTDVIIATLAERLGLPREDPAATPRAAAAHAFQTACEERLHQVLEWELFVHPAGFAWVEGAVRAELPRPLAALVARAMRRHFARQLRARGLARHEPETIAALGRRELAALGRYLEAEGWLGGAAPGEADCAAFGQVAPLVSWPMDTPVAAHARADPVLADWVARMRSACGL